jgi:apolipoprotein D and lipocalin family protein
MKLFLFIVFPLLIFGCSSYPPLEVVKNVDLKRYLGKWYEIAKLPNSFQKNCFCSTAEYSVIDYETIRVINSCRKDSFSGEPDQVSGKAFIVPNSNNAKLRVQFFWPFRGDYWIIELDDEDYQWAVVGTPSRKYLWILARSKSLDDALYNTLTEKIKLKGFDIMKIERTEHKCE